MRLEKAKRVVLVQSKYAPVETEQGVVKKRFWNRRILIVQVQFYKIIHVLRRKLWSLAVYLRNVRLVIKSNQSLRTITRAT